MQLSIFATMQAVLLRIELQIILQLLDYSLRFIL